MQPRVWYLTKAAAVFMIAALLMYGIYGGVFLAAFVLFNVLYWGIRIVKAMRTPAPTRETSLKGA